MLDPLDVILVRDETTTPPKFKMVVAICPAAGMFYRINSKPWRPAVALLSADHAILDHDSWLECGEPLELDDYLVEAALRRRGVLGRIDAGAVGEILQYLRAARFVSQADKDLIEACLRPLQPRTD